jgi:hypothetical protein
MSVWPPRDCPFCGTPMRVNEAHEYAQCPNRVPCGFGVILTGLEPQ